MRVLYQHFSSTFVTLIALRKVNFQHLHRYFRKKTWRLVCCFFSWVYLYVRFCSTSTSLRGFQLRLGFWKRLNFRNVKFKMSGFMQNAVCSLILLVEWILFGGWLLLIFPHKVIFIGSFSEEGIEMNKNSIVSTSSSSFVF